MKNPKTLVDASTIIALAKIGELDLLKIIFTEINITSVIREEILVENYPETKKIAEAIEDWIKVIETNEENLQKYEKHGLGRGEASLIEVTQENDRLVLDDPVAREAAEVEGVDFTGLIGLIVQACRNDLISAKKAEKILDKLSSSDFRMTAELYNWALKKLKKQNPQEKEN